MTTNNVPQGGAANLTAALQNLSHHLAATNANLGSYRKKDTWAKISGYMGKTLATFAGGLGIGHVAGTNMRKMEDLQKRALVIGSSANKLNVLNTKAINELKTNTYNKLEERMDLFADGFRDNNDELIKLAVRMRVTGQGTELLRRTMAQMNSVAGLNNDQIGDLSKTIVDYGNKYAVSNEKLLVGLNEMTEVFSTANLAGLGSQFEKFTVGMSARFPTMQNFSKVIEALTDFNKIQDFAIAGIDPNTLLQTITSTSLNLDQQMDKFVSEMSKFQSPAAGGDMRIAKIFADNFNTLGPLAEMANIMKHNENTNNVLAEKEDAYYASFSNYQSMASDFYSFSRESYKTMVDQGNVMISLMRGSQLGAGAGGALGVALGGLIKPGSSRMLGAIGAAAGPIGAIVGMAAGFAIDAFVNKSSGPLPEIAKNTKQTADILDKVHNSSNSDKSLGGTMGAIMSDALLGIMQHSKEPDSTPAETLKVLEQIRDSLARINAKPTTNGGQFINF